MLYSRARRDYSGIGGAGGEIIKDFPRSLLKSDPSPVSPKGEMPVHLLRQYHLRSSIIRGMLIQSRLAERSPRAVTLRNFTHRAYQRHKLSLHFPYILPLTSNRYLNRNPGAASKCGCSSRWLHRNILTITETLDFTHSA